MYDVSAIRSTEGAVQTFQSSVERKPRGKGHLELHNMKFCSSKILVPAGSVGGIPAGTTLVDADLRGIYIEIRKRLPALLLDNGQP